MGRKEGSQQEVWPSGCPLRPPRTRPNPPGPGQTPSPYLHPSGKTARGRYRDPPATAPALDEDPLEPLDFNPVTRASSTAADLCFTKVIGILRNR